MLKYDIKFEKIIYYKAYHKICKKIKYQKIFYWNDFIFAQLIISKIIKK